MFSSNLGVREARWHHSSWSYVKRSHWVRLSGRLQMWLSWSLLPPWNLHSFSFSDHRHGGQSCCRFLSTTKNDLKHLRKSLSFWTSGSHFVNLFGRVTVWGLSTVSDQSKFQRLDKIHQIHRLSYISPTMTYCQLWSFEKSSGTFFLPFPSILPKPFHSLFHSLCHTLFCFIIHLAAVIKSKVVNRKVDERKN